MAANRETSRRKAPAQPLGDAVEMLERVFAGLGSGPFSREAVAEALGHQGITGPASRKIGTLMHFGLLDRRGSQYHVSDIGKRIIQPTSPDERADAIVDAAFAPTLYQEIFEAFSEGALPTLFANVLSRQFGVFRKSSESVASIFKESAEFAGLLRKGILCQSREQSTERQQVQSGSPVDATREKEPQVSQTSSSMKTSHLRESEEEFAIPLTQGRSAVIRLMRPLQATDVSRLRAWIDLMSDVLVEEKPEAD